MATTTSSHAWLHAADAAAGLRFAREVGRDASGLPALEWRLARNCSLAPRQLSAALGSLALLALGIALLFWSQGATLVVPFASVELLALAAALIVYSRHAGDRERLLLADGRLTVERIDGLRTERVEFDASWVRIEPEHRDESLIALSGQGRRVFVGRFVRPELREPLARELRMAVLQRRARVRI
jgi:uncharacterized membrane protein